MSSPVQAHSKAIFRDSALGALVNMPTPIYLRRSGSDVVLSPDRPEDFAMYDVAGDGSYVTTDLTPVYVVSDGAGGYAVNQVGPAIALLVDDGAGGVVISTAITATPIADLFYDIDGNLLVVLRTADRLDGVQLGDDVFFY
jgi:hypothetical protein